MTTEKKLEVLQEIENKIFAGIEQGNKESSIAIPNKDSLRYLTKIHALIEAYKFQLAKEKWI